MQYPKKSYACFLLFIGLFGCSSVLDFNREEKFDPRLRAFSNAIRWSEFEEAQKFVRIRNNQFQNENLDFLKHIKVTKHQFIKNIFRQDTDQESTDIISIYDIDYYHDGNYKIQHMRYEQLWWYDETVGAWFLDKGLPQFKQ